MADITLKAGAALLLQIAAYDDEGTAFSLAGVTTRAQVRDAQSNLIATLPIVAGAAANLLTVAVTNTDAWPVGLLRCDLRMTVGGNDVITDTFNIYVQAATTR